MTCSKKALIYLDCLASTPLDPRVLEGFIPILKREYANASNLTHIAGREARDTLLNSRRRVACCIGARPEELVFTSGATEANNLAILGAVAARPGNRIVVASATEHASVLGPLRHLSRNGFKLVLLRIDRAGRVDAGDVERSLAARPALFSLMMVNNEIGTVHDVARFAAMARRRGVPFHCDAAQAPGKLRVDLSEIPADFLTLSAHKAYGPKGIGALFVRGGASPRKIKPIVFGGGQEGGLRSGTSNVPAAAAFAKAMELARDEGPADAVRLHDLTESLYEGIRSRVRDVVRVSPAEGVAPGVLNLAFPGIDAETLLGLASKLALSMGSACHFESRQASHVLRAICLPKGLLFSAVRFGLGRFTTPADVEFAARELAAKVRYLRRIGGKQSV